MSQASMLLVLFKKTPNDTLSFFILLLIQGSENIIAVFTRQIFINHMEEKHLGTTFLLY